MLLSAILSALLAGAAHAQGPGTVVDVTPTGAVEPAAIRHGAQYPVDSYLIGYESTALDGSSTVITAHLLVPRLPAPRKVPVYVFGTGTTGLIDRCAPSTEHIRGINWGQYRAHTLAHAGQGVIGIMPDYMGFGDPDMLQPYFVAEAEGRVMLDAIRAAANFVEQQGTNARAGGGFVAGFSQGGHAAFAAADRHADYGADVDLRGVIGYGPTTDVAGVLREFTVVAPMIIYTYSRLYGTDKIDPAAILSGQWAANLEHDVTSQCIGAMQQQYPWSPGPMFTAEFTEALLNDSLGESYPGVHELLEKNSTGLSGHGIPALILQGTEDVVINIDTQSAFVAELCRTGAAVRYPNYFGARHDTREVAFYDVQEWMRNLVDGGVPPTDCGLFAGGSY